MFCMGLILEVMSKYPGLATPLYGPGGEEKPSECSCTHQIMGSLPNHGGFQEFHMRKLLSKYLAILWVIT